MLGMLILTEDLATQIYYSRSYAESLAQLGGDRKRMKYLSIPAAEFFSGFMDVISLFLWVPDLVGLPASWTSPRPGVDASKLDVHFPKLEVRCVLGFSVPNSFNSCLGSARGSRRSSAFPFSRELEDWKQEPDSRKLSLIISFVDLVVRRI